MNPPQMQRITGAALVVVSLITLGACGSSGGSDSASNASTTAAATTDDTAFVTAANSACATSKTAVDAANEAAKDMTPADADAESLAQQKATVTQMETLAAAVKAADGQSDEAKAFTADIAALPDGYTALNEASAPLYSTEELSSKEAAEVEKQLEKPTDELSSTLQSAQDKAEKLGLTECVAMFKAIGPEAG